MAKKTETPSTITRELPKGAKRFSRTGDGLSKFVEGEEIRGIFRPAFGGVEIDPDLFDQITGRDDSAYRIAPPVG
jgi:hypothetical protein